MSYGIFPNPINPNPVTTVEYVTGIQTTSGTDVLAKTITIANNSGMAIHIQAVALRNDYTECYSIDLHTCASRDAGVPTIGTSTIYREREGSTPWPNLTCTVSGNDLIVQVNSNNARTFNWNFEIKIQRR